MSNPTKVILGWVELGLSWGFDNWDQHDTRQDSDWTVFLWVMPGTESRLSYYSDNWNPLSDIRLIQNSIQNTKSISERIRLWTIMQDQD